MNPDTDEAGYSKPRPESAEDWRVPSTHTRCRRAHCAAQPVADLNRSHRLIGSTWWAYCAEHLADYNREVRDGVVWWRGTRASAEVEA